MSLNKYPDGTAYSVVPSITEFTFKINSYEDLWHLNQKVDALNNLGIVPFVNIPNLIDAQADRRFNKNESFGLKLVLKQLINMDARFSIFHPHNPEVVEMAFEICGKKVSIIDNSVFISQILYGTESSSPRIETKNLILMSSDAGGFKPLMKLCDKIDWTGETFSASKSRKFENNHSSLIQEVNKNDFQGKDILIIDDICVKGGTFKGLAKMLRERNCGNIYLAVSHITIQNLGEDPVTDYFDKVFTTNSKYDSYWFLNKGGNESSIQNLEIFNYF